MNRSRSLVRHRLTSSRFALALHLALLMGIALVASGCAPAAVNVAAKRRWIEVRSEHFTIWTDQSEARARRQARDLEVFRAAVLLMIEGNDLTSRHPTWIYAFNANTSFGPFNVSDRTVGYMIPRLRANVLTTSDDRSMGASNILKHEYTHWLLRNGSGLVYPMWFDEGFAEFMALAQEKRRAVVLGNLADHRLSNLKYSAWIPMAEFLEPVDYPAWRPEKQGMFYAQAWVFVNYWYTDSARREIMQKGLGPYIEATQNGVPVEEAFETYFGTTLREAERAVRAYWRRAKLELFGVQLSALEFSEEMSVRQLPENEVAERLGSLCFMLDDLTCARGLFEHAVAVAPESARAVAGLAAVERTEGNDELAHSLFDRAVELDPKDALSFVDRGQASTIRATRTADPEARRRLLKSARRDFVRASKIGGPTPETYASYGMTFLLPGEPHEKGLDTLEGAHRLVPGDRSIRLALADLYILLGRRDDAVRVARPAFVATHRNGISAKSQALLDAIAAGESRSITPYSRLDLDE